MEIIAVVTAEAWDVADVIDAIAEIEPDSAKVKGIREMADIGGVPTGPFQTCATSGQTQTLFVRSKI